MAYTFNKLQGQIDEEDKQKQDIFATEGPQGFGLTSDQTEKPQPQDAAKKTESGLSLTAPTGGTSETPKAVKQPEVPRGASEQRQATLDTQRTQMPQGLARLGSDLAQKESSLRPAKSEYLNPFNQQDFGLSPETIDKAVGGDLEAAGLISGLFSKDTPGVLAGAFKAPKTVTPQIEQIQTQGGLEKYLRQQAGPQYTAGEGSFDVASLGRDPRFNLARAELARRESILGDKASGLESTLPGEAEGILADKYTDAQTVARGGLTDRRTSIEDLIALAQTSKRDKLADIISRSPELSQKYGTASARALSEALPDEMGLDDLINQSVLQQNPFLGVDPSDYFSTRDTPISRGEVATPEQVAQFNRIQDLLAEQGKGLTDETGAGLSSFDEQGFQQALQNAAQAERDRLSKVEATEGFEDVKDEFGGALPNTKTGEPGPKSWDTRKLGQPSTLDQERRDFLDSLPTEVSSPSGTLDPLGPTSVPLDHSIIPVVPNTTDPSFIESPPPPPTPLGAPVFPGSSDIPLPEGPPMDDPGKIIPVDPNRGFRTDVPTTKLERHLSGDDTYYDTDAYDYPYLDDIFRTAGEYKLPDRGYDRYGR